MATMQCDVVSVKESIYSGQVTMLIAKGAGGELGILPGHAPLVTLLQRARFVFSWKMVQKKSFMYQAVC